MNKLSVFFILLFASLSASASSILIKGADIYSTNGLLPKSNIYIENGIITAIGRRRYGGRWAWYEYYSRAI